MKTAKAILQDNSDGSADDTDVPPTPQDKAMTIDHTSDSIIYNVPHAKDHLDEIVEKAQRLKGYEPAKAKKLVKNVLKEMRPIMDKLEAI